MKKALIITAVILVLLASLSGFVIGITARLSVFNIFLSLTPSIPLFSEANVLILGLDGNRGYRSDTIMVLHINPAKKEAYVISIPRDTIAVLPDRGLDKINHAYAYGGIDLTRRTVENLLHVNIPYYATINLAGIENLIDELGGVTIDVEKRMYYVDYAGGLYIDLPPGPPTLNGKQAMGYLRFRHSDNDFARIGRQQKFVKALGDQMMKRENILKTPSLFLALLACVSTNLNSRETLGLSLALRSANELGQVLMTMIPGNDMLVDGVYYWKADEAALQRIVEQYILGKRLASSG